MQSADVLQRITAVLALSLVCGAARADESPEPADAIDAPPPSASAPTQELPRPHGSYAESILLADGISLATSFIGVGVVGYLVAAPAIHIHHHHYGRAAISLGMRVSFPIVGAIAGQALGEKCGPDFCVAKEVIVGLAVGVLTAMIVDATALGGPSDPPPKESAMKPTFALGPSGASAGFALSF